MFAQSRIFVLVCSLWAGGLIVSAGVRAQGGGEPAAVLAEVKVEEREAIPLGTGAPWQDVPDFLKNARSFEKATAKTSNQLRYEVVKDGWMLLAVSWTYDGNSGGGWKETAWTEAKFLDQGWQPVGRMTRLNADKKPDLHMLYRKAVKAGEKVQLHNRKYNAPVVISPAPEQAAAVAALKPVVSAQQKSQDDKTPLIKVDNRSPTGSALVGVRVTIETIDDERRIGAVQPLYAGDPEPVKGRQLGVPVGNTIEVRAKPGYVVGGVALSSDVHVRGLRVAFVRQTATGIDRSDSYQSRWIGDQVGATEQPANLEGDQPARGLHGEFQPYLRKLELLKGK